MGNRSANPNQIPPLLQRPSLALVAALAMSGFAMASFMAGCAGGAAATSTTSAAAATTATATTTAPGTPAGTGAATAATGGSAPYASGSTVPLTVDLGVLSAFFAPPGFPVNNATNIDINIDLSLISEPIKIGYDTTNGGGFERVLGLQNPVNPGFADGTYNAWYTINGTTYWKGFFQDEYGAILIVLNPNGSGTTSVGDGGTGVTTGAVYYQNFVLSYPYNPYQGPLAMCWQITAGNHDCRTFLINGIVQMGSAVYPSAADHGPNISVGYQKLGTFTGIDRSLANF